MAENSRQNNACSACPTARSPDEGRNRRRAPEQRKETAKCGAAQKKTLRRVATPAVCLRHRRRLFILATRPARAHKTKRGAVVGRNNRDNSIAKYEAGQLIKLQHIGAIA